MTSVGAVLVAIVLSVTDGDTVRVRVPKWTASPMGTVGMRVYGIDTCEKNFALGRDAKEYAAELLPPQTRVKFVYRGDDKFGGRVLGTIRLPDGRDFATVMIGKGLARPYFGKKKDQSWCK